MNFLQELLALKEQDADQAVSAGDLKIDDQVHDQLDQAADDEELDAQCFGLEMEDGKVVKVYVKKEDAENFEDAMSKRLGEDDDIKSALDELGKDFDIIEIKWPDEDEQDDEDDEETPGDDEDGEEEEDGSDAIDDEVEGAIERDKQEESAPLTLGQRFAKRLTELKWTDEDDKEYSSAAAKQPAKSDDDEEGNEEQDPDIPDEDAEKQTQPQGVEGSWKIDKDDKGISIANDRFSIELDDDELMELQNAISDKKIARFKNEHGKVVYVFTPKGSDYILQTPEYRGGFRIPQKVLTKILN